MGVSERERRNTGLPFGEELKCLPVTDAWINLTVLEPKSLRCFGLPSTLAAFLYRLHMNCRLWSSVCFLQTALLLGFLCFEWLFRRLCSVASTPRRDGENAILSAAHVNADRSKKKHDNTQSLRKPWLPAAFIFLFCPGWAPPARLPSSNKVTWLLFNKPLCGLSINTFSASVPADVRGATSITWDTHLLQFFCGNKYFECLCK